MGKIVLIGDRLRLERERLGMSQTALGDLAKVGRKTQFNYESGDRFPDAAYLAAVAAAGVDVRYVVTGERDYVPPPALSAEEQRLVALYRLADAAVRKAVLGALAVGEVPMEEKRRALAVSPAPAKTARRGATVTIHGDVGQKIEGDQVVHGPLSFNMGGARGRKPQGGKS